MTWFDRSAGDKKNPSEDRPNPALGSFGEVEKGPSQSSEEGLVAYLYKGSRVTGQLTFHGPEKIDGSVEGEVRCRGILTIGEEAEVRAKISGEVVVIRGRVEGDVAAREKVELESPARLFGNIDAPRVIIAEGAVFDGDCSMGGAREKGEAQSPLHPSSEKAIKDDAPKRVTNKEK